MRKIRTGNVFHSRTGKKYKIGSHDAKGFTVRRLGSGDVEEGKPVKVTFAKVQRTVDALLAKRALAFQTNYSKGGIDYTVAIEAGIVYALGEMVATDTGMRMFRLADGYSGPTVILETQGEN